MANEQLDPTFAAAVASLLNPDLQAKQIYAAAFADAVKQLNAGMESPKTLASEIRAKAQQLTELADLIDTTLAATVPSEQEPDEEDGSGEGDGKAIQKPKDQSPREQGTSEGK